MKRPHKQKLQRISQGDIYSDIDFIEYVVEKGGHVEISCITFPLVIVLTQDCDLEQDFRYRYGRPKSKIETQDKLLLSVLVSPLYNAEHFRLGQHLSELDIQMQTINSRQNENIKINQNPRYHYLEFPDDYSIPKSIIDFKHYFSVNIEYLKREKKRHFVCRLPVLYRENLSQRYGNFLARIGLPQPQPTG